MINNINLFFLFIFVSLAIGCAGQQTFHELARPGDTIAVAAGYKHFFQRDNITVTITDYSGGKTTYYAGDPNVRAAVNLYPDPLSSWIVSDRIGVDQTPGAQAYAIQNNIHNTNGDYDWWQTVVFVDLPVTMQSTGLPMATGKASIKISNDITPPWGTQETHSATVDIVTGAGQKHNFNAITTNTPAPTEIPFALALDHYKALERVPYATLNFSGSAWTAYTKPPYAIQVDLSHHADESNGGAVGAKAYVANPVGHIKSVAWSDDGFNTRIIMMPNRDADISDFKDFKLYLAGITGWAVVSTQVFDIDGATIVPNDVIGTIN